MGGRGPMQWCGQRFSAAGQRVKVKFLHSQSAVKKTILIVSRYDKWNMYVYKWSCHLIDFVRAWRDLTKGVEQEEESKQGVERNIPWKEPFKWNQNQVLYKHTDLSYSFISKHFFENNLFTKRKRQKVQQ